MERELASESIFLLYEETKKRLDELTILYEMTKISHSALHFDLMLSEIVKAISHFLGLERLSVLLFNEKSGRFTLHPSSIGLSPKTIETPPLGLDQGIIGWVVEHKTALLVNDVRNDSRYFATEEGILSEMSVPLESNGKLIGVLDAQSYKKEAFSKEDFRLFEVAAGHLATLIESAASEERYRTVVESALDGVLVMGEDFRLTYVNERLAELLGYPREELLEANFISFLDEKSQALLLEEKNSHPKELEEASRYEIKVLRRDGAVRYVEMSSILLRDYHGNRNKIAFLKDITEKRKIEEQLLQSEKLRAVGEMASGVAHDFNNSLAIILGNTQLLLLTIKEKEQVETLKIIEKVVKDSAQTVRRLLEFTRNGIREDLYSVDINMILKEAIEMTRPRWKDEAQGRGFPIEMVTDFGKIPPAEGNVSELREVLMNMIFNAIEAMPTGGRIEIRSFHQGGKVTVQVSDTGIGMSEDVRRRVFEPFFTTKPFSNSGLGLSMSYGIIKRFGGEIHVDSEPGRGTTFTITLNAGHEIQKDKIFEEPLEPTVREAKILVIDDEEMVRKVLHQVLSKGSHQVVTARNGLEGLQLFGQEKFDVVLTDLGMPDLSGWEVCRAVKAINPQTLVGMITGWGTEVSEEKRKEYGIDFVIPKPFDFHRILNLVATSIQSPK